MAFKFPWSRKKVTPTPEAGRAEAQTKPENDKKADPPAIAEKLPEKTPADLICEALDQMSQALLATDSNDPRQELKLDAAQSLQDLRLIVTGDACAFPDLDEEIIRTIHRFDTLCTTCTREQLEGHLDRLKKAIGARRLTVDNCHAFEPTMETHFYELHLISLQGTRNAQLAGIAELQQELEFTLASPDYDADASMEFVNDLRDNIAAEKDAVRLIDTEISKTRRAYLDSLIALRTPAPDALLKVDDAKIRLRLEKRTRRYTDELIRIDQERVSYLIRRNAWLQELRGKKFLLKHARLERQRLQAEAEALMNLDDDRFEQPAAPVQQAEAPVEEAAAETPVDLPVMPDVFDEEFAPQVM